MKTIQLKNGMGRYSDVSPFPLGELELEISGIPDISADFRFVAKCNGAKCAQETVSATQNRVTIPADKLSAGRFSCHVEQYVRGELVKVFKVEDLFVTDLAGELEADPEIAQLFRRVESLEDLKSAVMALAVAVDAEKREREAMDKRLSTLEQNSDIFTN